MKKVITIFSVLVSFVANAQDADKVSVEKSVFGIQTGFLGVWIHNEARLCDQIALRSEVGMDSGLWMNSFYENVGYVMTPVIALEPRWYYNLDKRQSQSRSTANNSGNFVAIVTSYHPDWFVISNYDNLRVVSDISVVPTWGIRRYIGKHFNYETGIGIGYRYIFAKQAGYAENDSEAALNLHLRLGYTF